MLSNRLLTTASRHSHLAVPFAAIVILLVLLVPMPALLLDVDEAEAQRRRADIGQAAEFHGSMDGAIRFTQRDAVASILYLLSTSLPALRSVSCNTEWTSAMRCAPLQS